MSLTSKIKESSSKRLQASDGMWYALQKVNTTNMIVQSGNVADLMSLRDGNNDLEKLLMVDPNSASRALKTAMQMKPDVVKAGLIGEYDEAGTLHLYKWVDKPAVLLEFPEINVSLIPEALIEEFFEAITELSPKAPEIKEDVIQTFPTV